MKVGPVTWLLFLLLGSLWKEAQQAPEIERNCGEHEYFNLNQRKCCARCPPGTYASSQCTANSDTSCKPCPRDFYNEKWIYADKCKFCRPCPEDAGLVATVNCSATTAAECDCQDGFVCELVSPLGKCMHCRRVTTPPPTEESSTDQRKNDGNIVKMPMDAPDNGTTLWIIITVIIGLIFLGFILLLVTNKHVLKKIVGVMGTEKDKKPSPSLDTADARTENGVTKDNEKLLHSPGPSSPIALFPECNGTQSTDLSQNPAEANSHNTEDNSMHSVHPSDSTRGQSSDYIWSFRVSGHYPHLSIPVMPDDDLPYPIQEETQSTRD